jgi:fructose-bisphosphate aldolase class II
VDLNSIRAQTKRARGLFERTRNSQFAVGAFNIDNQETLIAVVQACAAKNSPALVEVSQSEVEAMGLNNIRDMVDNYRRQFGVELYVNLDHSPSVKDAMAGIDAGFEFIHIDISQARHNATDEEIAAETKKVVKYSKKTGALVEAEQHYFMGSSNLHTEAIDFEEVKKTFTKPKEAKKFVKQTGIDTLAVSIGNLHGKYPVPKRLDIDLLRQIRAEVDCYISLHGGSGTREHFFTEAIRYEVSKININSDLRYVFRKELEKVLDENADEYAVVKLMPQVISAVQKVVEAKIDMFGSANKAYV